jgi:hypothetical protein
MLPGLGVGLVRSGAAAENVTALGKAIERR